jgi:anti-sigma-K factor RskA
VTAHVTDDLDLYAAGWLEPDERSAVERHLGECAECRRALALSERTIWTLADAAARPTPRDLRERVLAPHRARSRWVLPRLRVAVAAAVVLLLGAGVVAGGRVVALDASAGASGRAALLVVPGGTIYLLLAMPPAPPDRAYEAWVIRDGTALPAGLTLPGASFAALALGPAPRTGDIAAITLEVAGGTDRPTSDPLLLRKL